MEWLISGETSAAITSYAIRATTGHSLACPEDYVRVFTDEGTPMGTLLTQLIAAREASRPPSATSNLAAWPGSWRHTPRAKLQRRSSDGRWSSR